jgi:dTMP kinase
MSALFSDVRTEPGLLVTLDGPNGSGKSTLAAALAHELAAERTVYSTCQPSATPLGELIRHSERSFHGRALACLVAADRHHQLASEILPQLRDGKVVICDRYVESSLVLQVLDGVPVEDVLAINAGLLRPDVRFSLCLSVTVLRARLATRERTGQERFECASDAAERELDLYAQADRLLGEQGFPSTILETDSSSPEACALEMVRIVRACLLTRMP